MARQPVRGLSGTVAGAAVAGFSGMALVVLGAAQPSSPFTSKLPGSWIFGLPRPGSAPASHALIGMALVYAGIVLVVGAWYCIVTFPPPSDRTPLYRLWWVFALWVSPLLVAPPLFSRDVYTYGAEGELVSRGIDPYSHGLQSVRGSTFFELADPLWRHAHAPYGPVFFDLARADAHLTSSVFTTVEAYRLLALVGVVLVAVSVPVLARSFGRDPSTAFALAALNPLVLLYLIGGAHNDAIMVGLLVAALALARVAATPWWRSWSVPSQPRSRCPRSSGSSSSDGIGPAPTRPGGGAPCMSRDPWSSPWRRWPSSQKRPGSAGAGSGTSPIPGA